MSFADDFTYWMGKIAQGVVDYVAGGETPTLVLMRQQVNALKKLQDNLISTYKQEQPQTAAWMAPVNDTANEVTSMLQKTSEYVQGIAFSYGSVLQSGSVDIPVVTAIQKAGMSPDKLLDLEIPSEIGGFPSILIPGVFTINMAEGLINAFADSFTLPKQIETALSDNQKIGQAIQDVRTLHQNLTILKDYLLDLATHAITVYQHTTGLQFDPMPLSAATATDLASLNPQILGLLERLDALNTSVFIIYRTIIRLTENEKISASGATAAQVDYITNQLYRLSTISAVFPSKDALRKFVADFFQGEQMAILPTFLNLPPIPDAVKSMVTLTPSQKSSFDLNAPKYDPPGSFDFDDFPGDDSDRDPGFTDPPKRMEEKLKITERIESVSPAAQVAAGFGQLLWIRGSNMPGVVVFAQNGREYAPQWTAVANPNLAIVRLPFDLVPGTATVCLTDADRTVTTPDFSITISSTPGTPVITAAKMLVGEKILPGQEIGITAEGMDTSGAVIEWIHPNLPKLTSPSKETRWIPGSGNFTVITIVPNVTPNDTWTLSLRVRVGNTLSAACLYSLRT